MKRFKTKKLNKKKVDFILLTIMLITLFILHFYNSNISPKIVDIASSKLEEISTLHVKKDIMPVVKVDKLINVVLNDKEEIIYVDIDYDYANEILINAVSKIQKNLLELEKGNVEDFSNGKELKSHNGNLYLLLPIGLAYDGFLFSNLGPKIPIKLSFYEHVLGNVDTEITSYGINNALLTVYLNISLEQKIIIPYKEQKFTRTYSLTIGSKVINGKVPSIYGGTLKNSSNILEST